MYTRLLNLEGRQLTNTRFVSMETLHDMGIAADFLSLMHRIGFKPEFWTIRDLTFENATREMLSSLQLKPTDDNPNSVRVKFRLLDHTYRVSLQQIRDIFGFEEPTPGIHSKRFRLGMTRDTFWKLITSSLEKKGWKECRIQHPLLRVIHQAIATTIYGQVSTLSCCTTKDLQLMDFMLRPTAVQPDHAFMVKRDQSVSTRAVYLWQLEGRSPIPLPYRRRFAI